MKSSYFNIQLEQIGVKITKKKKQKMGKEKNNKNLKWKKKKKSFLERVYH